MECEAEFEGFEGELIFLGPTDPPKLKVWKVDSLTDSLFSTNNLQYSFTREIEIISSTLQPPSTVHSFSFDLATPDSGSKGISRESDHIHRSSTSSTKDGLHVPSSFSFLLVFHPSRH